MILNILDSVHFQGGACIPNSRPDLYCTSAEYGYMDKDVQCTLCLFLLTIYFSGLVLKQLSLLIFMFTRIKFDHD